MKIITAFTNKSFGIGKNNKLPWSLPEDMHRFSKITTENTVVMGKNTWLSLNQTALKGRFNIVVTSEDGDGQVDNPNVVYIKKETLENIEDVINYGDIFIIGGSHLYREFVGRADTILATVIDQQFDCDTFFPTENLHKYDIQSSSPQLYSASSNLSYRFVTYKLRKDNERHQEYQYLDLMSSILSKGEARPDRTGVGTLALFGTQMRFDIEHSVPFITTKYLAWKMVIYELLWFLSGSCDSRILEKKGVNIWKGNSSREFLDSVGLQNYVEGDVGPLYSHSMRSFGAEYTGCETDYTNKGFDQLKHVINTLKTDPYSRRHLMTTFNPAVVDQCALMPCHGIAIQFYVSGDEEYPYLSCHVYCRSSDTFLGLPFNIASYSILTYLIAKMVGMRPKDLIISTGDTHIYANHIEQVRAQLTRNPLPFPKLTVSDQVKNKDISQVTIDDFQLDGYLFHPSIKAPMAI